MRLEHLKKVIDQYRASGEAMPHAVIRLNELYLGYTEDGVEDSTQEIKDSDLFGIFLMYTIPGVREVSIALLQEVFPTRAEAELVYNVVHKLQEQEISHRPGYIELIFSVCNTLSKNNLLAADTIRFILTHNNIIKLENIIILLDNLNMLTQDNLHKVFLLNTETIKPFESILCCLYSNEILTQYYLESLLSLNSNCMEELENLVLVYHNNSFLNDASFS